MYNTKNYTEQGGDKTVIGGTIEILSGASAKGLRADPEKVTAIKSYLVTQGNATTGGELVVEGYFEE